MRTVAEIENIVRDMYATYCGKWDCHELTVSLDPGFSSYVVTHEGNGKHVKIPSRYFPEHTNHFPIATLRNFLSKIA